MYRLGQGLKVLNSWYVVSQLLKISQKFIESGDYHEVRCLKKYKLNWAETFHIQKIVELIIIWTVSVVSVKNYENCSKNEVFRS